MYDDRTQAALGHREPPLSSASRRGPSPATPILEPGKRISILHVGDHETKEKHMSGVISSVENHGSIIIVWLDLEDGGSEPIYLDHRAFGWLVEGEGIETVSDLEGRPVEYNGEVIEFLDNVEIA